MIFYVLTFLAGWLFGAGFVLLYEKNEGFINPDSFNATKEELGRKSAEVKTHYVENNL